MWEVIKIISVGFGGIIIGLNFVYVYGHNKGKKEGD